MAHSTRMPWRKIEIEAIMLWYKKGTAKYWETVTRKCPTVGKCKKSHAPPGFQDFNPIAWSVNPLQIKPTRKSRDDHWIVIREYRLRLLLAVWRYLYRNVAAYGFAVIGSCWRLKPSFGPKNRGAIPFARVQLDVVPDPRNTATSALSSANCESSKTLRGVSYPQFAGRLSMRGRRLEFPIWISKSALPSSGAVANASFPCIFRT